MCSKIEQIENTERLILKNNLQLLSDLDFSNSDIWKILYTIWWSEVANLKNKLPKGVKEYIAKNYNEIIYLFIKKYNLKI